MTTVAPSDRDGVESNDRLRQVWQLDGDPGAARDAERRQRGSEPIHLFLELAIGELAVEKDQRGGIGVLPGAEFQEGRKRPGLEIEARRNALVTEPVPDAWLHHANSRIFCPCEGIVNLTRGRTASVSYAGGRRLDSESYNGVFPSLILISLSPCPTAEGSVFSDVPLTGLRRSSGPSNR